AKWSRAFPTVSVLSELLNRCRSRRMVNNARVAPIRRAKKTEERAGPRWPGMRGQGSESSERPWTRLAENPRGGNPLWVKCSRRDLNPCQKLERLLSLATRL